MPWVKICLGWLVFPWVLLHHWGCLLWHGNFSYVTGDTIVQVFKYGSMLLETRAHTSQGFAWPCFGYGPKDSSGQLSCDSAASCLVQTCQAQEQSIHLCLFWAKEEDLSLLLYHLFMVSLTLSFHWVGNICQSPDAQCWTAQGQLTASSPKKHYTQLHTHEGEQEKESLTSKLVKIQACRHSLSRKTEFFPWHLCLIINICFSAEGWPNLLTRPPHSFELQMEILDPGLCFSALGNGDFSSYLNKPPMFNHFVLMPLNICKWDVTNTALCATCVQRLILCRAWGGGRECPRAVSCADQGRVALWGVGRGAVLPLSAWLEKTQCSC